MEDKILIVDDDIICLEMMESLFSRLGIKTSSARDGAHAIEILKKDSFSLVISDINMPHVDGVELLHFIKRHAPETDVILITGYSEKYSFTDIIKEGATDYLKKPFIKDAIEAKVKRVFRERDEIAYRKQIEAILIKKSHDLGDRVRELNYLYEVSKLIDRCENELEELLRGVVKLIPSAWKYPKLVVARIVYQDKTYTSPDFRETPWLIGQSLQINKKESGRIEIFYLEDVAEYFEGSYLKEKINLINETADKISLAIERQITNEMLKQTTEQLRQSHQNLEKKVKQRTRDLHEAKSELISVFENVPDGIISVDTSMVVLHKNNQCMADLTIKVGNVFQPGANKFQQECHEILAATIKKQEPVIDYRLEISNSKGDHRTFLLSSSCLTRSNGEPKGALLVIHDITQVAVLENQLRERRHFRKIVGESLIMQEIFQRIRQVASVDTTILVTGESGVGKELVVDTLHAQGDRSAAPLVKVNCSALPENLLESELFGHVKGAFTGADQDRTGRIELAEGGILFLDEIGDISPRLQLQLLRFFEQKEYERVGESQKRKANVRVFTATNADLGKKVQNNSFREDLYYRLKVMVIHVPPLRERQEDIPFLVEHFLALFNDKFKKRISKISEKVLDAFMTYYWPGNVREFKHAIEHAFLLCQGDTLELEHFPKDMFSRQLRISTDIQPSRTLTRENLLAALNRSQWHKTKTAKLLKISRATLYNKLKEFDLTQGNA